MLKSRPVLFVCVLFGGLLSGCSLPDLSINNNPSSRIYGLSTMRHLIVNDSARNDSLPNSLTGKGVLFIMQPGRSYTLRLHTGATGDALNLLYLNNNELQGAGTFLPQVADSEELFTLPASANQAAYFVGQLQINDTLRRPRSKLRLVPVNPVESNTLAVHLFLVGRLTNLSDSSAKAAFAGNFLSQLRAIYSNYGVTLATTYEILGPDTAVTLTFGGTFVSLPGNRVSGSAHLYLVDNISAVNIPAGEYVLGFAPHEVLNLDQDPDSRVILSMRGSGGNYTAMAYTAAHELGHFFGMRHTTSSTVDTASDHDQSNVEDGLVSTPACNRVLTKKAAGSFFLPAIGPGSKPYCLYVASTTCPVCADSSNLMFYEQCGQAPQSLLTTEQQLLIRRNLALLQEI